VRSSWNQNLNNKDWPYNALIQVQPAEEVKVGLLRGKLETHLGNVVVFAERLQMVIEVSNSVLVSFASEFRDFDSKLESAVSLSYSLTV
jgi:hypothetical protein